MKTAEEWCVQMHSVWPDIETVRAIQADALASRDAEVEALKARLFSPYCPLAGPGRGDCFHFIGLPGQSIPGQHDGPDDTVDAYGKPNGWCWACWRSHVNSELRKEVEALKKRIAEVEDANKCANALIGDTANELQAIIRERDKRIAELELAVKQIRGLSSGVTTVAVGDQINRLALRALGEKV